MQIPQTAKQHYSGPLMQNMRCLGTTTYTPAEMPIGLMTHTPHRAALYIEVYRTAIHMCG